MYWARFVSRIIVCKLDFFGNTTALSGCYVSLFSPFALCTLSITAFLLIMYAYFQLLDVKALPNSIQHYLSDVCIFVSIHSNPGNGQRIVLSKKYLTIHYFLYYSMRSTFAFHAR